VRGPPPYGVLWRGKVLSLRLAVRYPHLKTTYIWGWGCVSTCTNQHGRCPCRCTVPGGERLFGTGRINQMQLQNRPSKPTTTSTKVTAIGGPKHSCTRPIGACDNLFQGRVNSLYYHRVTVDAGTSTNKTQLRLVLRVFNTPTRCDSTTQYVDVSKREQSRRTINCGKNPQRQYTEVKKPTWLAGNTQ